ncbi:MAG: hypothetical protein KC496_10200 [Anaerolineae bacterium]|nr:hypothetical protein [Anaerolineae bacterium]
MNRRFIFGFINGLLLWTSLLMVQAQVVPPTLEDFWEGRAEWVLDQFDVGLPMGESDTVLINESEYRAYLHASSQSAGVIDQCGDPVQFPGCTTLWQSEDGGDHFSLEVPVCLLPCGTCPCDDQRDHITAQQYPRVAVADDGMWYMVYEWHAQTILRRSEDGLYWPDEWDYLTFPSGVWPRDFHPCEPIEDIGDHPNIRGEGDVCLVGAPPGIYIEGDTLYVFVTAGSAPAHLRCYKGNRHGDLGELEICDTDPLFTGAQTYGDPAAAGLAAAPYFDFRYISSADVLKVGDYYYMAYEGIRGPSVLEYGRDNQFGLGFARATAIDSQWERYEGNPVLVGLVDNWGIGHADLLIVDGETVMLTATSRSTRGRYVLRWIDAP